MDTQQPLPQQPPTPPSRDTIPAGQRLIPFVSSGTSFTLSRRKAHRLANDLAHIEALLRAYNVALKHLTLTQRASANLTVPHLSQHLDGTLTLIHHDSPGWLATQSPALPRAGNTAKVVGNGVIPRPINPASRAELRAYAIRRGVSIKEAWHRFPPVSSAEQAEYLKATSSIRQRAPSDPFESAVKAAARKANKPLDANFKAEFKAKIEGIASLLGDLL